MEEIHRKLTQSTGAGDKGATPYEDYLHCDLRNGAVYELLIPCLRQEVQTFRVCRNFPSNLTWLQ